MTRDELGVILRDHGLWLAGAGGKRANLTWANLRDAYLRDAYLEGADLRGADLAGADMRMADLAGAILPDGYRALKVGRWSGLLRLPEGRLDVGCQSHTFGGWRERLDEIAIEHRATYAEIAEVRKILEEVGV